MIFKYSSWLLISAFLDFLHIYRSSLNYQELVILITSIIMLATQETIKLMELLQENLIQGNFDMLRNIAEQPGIHPSIRDKMLAITKLFQQTILQSNIHEVDVFFYRDFLKEVMGGQISEANINNRLDITREKKEEAINILRRIRSSEQSRINAQIELKEKKKLVDSLRSKIELPSEVEKDYKSKQQKFAQIISQHEEQIQALKCNIQSQVEIIKESMVRQEESIDQLKRKQEEISRLKEKEKEKDKQIFKLKYQLTDIKQELQKSQLLLSQSNGKSQILSFQVNQKQEVLENLFKKESQYRSIIQSRTQESSRLKEENQLLRRQVEEAKASKAIKRRSTRQLFIDSNSLIQQFQMNEAAADSFNQTLTKKVGEVLSMSSLYNYTLHKAENFHKRVDSKNNILLLCLTKDNRIVGGFSSSGFSLKGEEHNSKAFLFSFYQDKMKVFDLKKGKKSTLYDSDFIIFGNEQLCIEKGSDVLTSYFVNGCSNALNYQYDKVSDRQQFISEVEARKNSVQLLNYELIQLKIRND